MCRFYRSCCRKVASLYAGWITVLSLNTFLISLESLKNCQIQEKLDELWNWGRTHLCSQSWVQADGQQNHQHHHLHHTMCLSLLQHLLLYNKLLSEPWLMLLAHETPRQLLKAWICFISLFPEQPSTCELLWSQIRSRRSISSGWTVFIIVWKEELFRHTMFLRKMFERENVSWASIPEVKVDQQAVKHAAAVQSKHWSSLDLQPFSTDSLCEIKLKLCWNKILLILEHSY